MKSSCLIICVVASVLSSTVSQAEPDVAKLYDYAVTLDDSPRAKQKDSLYWEYASAADFAKLKEQYDPTSFDVWVEKLKGVQTEMTLEEISTLLKPKKICPMMTYGAGTVTIIELDNAYYVHGIFDPEKRLKVQLSHPIAINYGIRLVDRKHLQVQPR